VWNGSPLQGISVAWLGYGLRLGLGLGQQGTFDGNAGRDCLEELIGGEARREVRWDLPLGTRIQVENDELMSLGMDAVSLGMHVCQNLCC